MIRLILVLITVVAFLILSIPILVVEWLIGKKNPKLRDESSLHIVQFIFLKEARSKVIDGILASRTDCKECKPVYEKYQKIFFKKTKEKFKQEHPEVTRYEKAAAYLAKHPDDKDKTKNELQQEQETLLSEIAELKVPLTEVQEDLKKLRDIRYWVRKATPGTEESKEPPKKQPIKEVLQDKADEKKAQRTAPAQAKHRQQDMEL